MLCNTHTSQTRETQVVCVTGDDNSSRLMSTTKNERIVNAIACLLNYSMNELCYRIYWIGASHHIESHHGRYMYSIGAYHHALFRF